MRYFIAHHQHKGKPIDAALRKEGWRYQLRKVDIALFDHAINRTEPEKGRNLIHRFYREGATIVLYPHAATGAWWMDGDIFPKEGAVQHELVIAEGQERVSKIINPDMRVHKIGWSYCPIREFQKPKRLKRILFAPIHGPIKGHLREECVAANKRVYETLLDMVDKYQIVIRHLNSLEQMGLWYSPKPVFVLGKPDGSYKDIDAADLVIAEGTFMYLAVARGKPTIGINQHVPIRPNNAHKEFVPKHWDEYGEYMGYPIDFDDGDIISLIDKAMVEQTSWKSLFIGEPMKSNNLSKTLQNIRGQDARQRKS